jgi:hypothetical protein
MTRTHLQLVRPLILAALAGIVGLDGAVAMRKY